MKKIKGLCGDLAERLALPGEALGGELCLSAVGNRRLLIENHRGVLAYTEEEIRVGSERGQLVLRGGGLHLSAMDRSELLVAGRLQSIAWE